MKYELRMIGKKYRVYEVKTKQYLFETEDRITCESLVKKLTAGSGFDGITPSFFNNLGYLLDNDEYIC